MRKQYVGTFIRRERNTCRASREATLIRSRIFNKKIEATAVSFARRDQLTAAASGPAEWPKDHAHGPRQIRRGRGRFSGRFRGDFANPDIASRIGPCDCQRRQSLTFPTPDRDIQGLSRAVDQNVGIFGRGRSSQPETAGVAFHSDSFHLCPSAAPTAS